MKKRNINQKIGQIGLDCVTPSPISNVSADLMGPFRIKNRERITWVLIYLFNVLKALHLQPVENYTAKAIITALNTIFGAGNSITKSKKLILESLLEEGSRRDTIYLASNKVDSHLS